MAASAEDWSGGNGKPRMAKDAAYAGAVREAWAADEDVRAGGSGKLSEAPLVYEHAGISFYGRVVQPEKQNGAGVVLIHTAVGPRDVFLHWKAEALASLGYTVLIADMLGDESGQGWEPEWSVPARQPMADDRSLSRLRARAGVQALAGVPGVEQGRIAAMGYCFGGRAVLDLARLGAEAGVVSVVSFHGILDDGVIPSADMSSEGCASVLICHGGADPFVSQEGRKACEEQLRGSGARWDIMTFEGVRHGFTNPAQDLNDNPAFGFDPDAASDSWRAAKDLLSRTLLQ